MQQVGAGESTLCRVVSQIPLQRLVVNNKLVTSWQLPRLRVSYGETCCVMDFRHYPISPIVRYPI